MNDLKQLRETRDSLLRQTRNPYGPEWMRQQARRELQSITRHIEKLEKREAK